jgi:hypothetical protein
MSDRDLNLLHVVGNDTPASRLEVLGILRALPELGGQRVIQFGQGAIERAGLGDVERVAVPFGIDRFARRALEAAIPTTGRTIVHVWSGRALGWVRQTVRGAARGQSGLDPDRVRLLMEVELPLDSRWSANLVRQSSGQPGVRFVCPSRAAQRRLWASGVPPDQCALVRDSVDRTAIETAHRATMRRQLHLLPEHVGVLILPPVRRETGALIAAWGAMLLEHARPGVRLIVPGVSREAARVVRLVESCRLHRMLRAVGRRYALPELLAASDLAVYVPAKDASLSGVAYAMAAGRPIVAADVPVIRELLAPGRTAWLCEANNPREVCRRMLQALEHQPQSDRQAEAARAQADVAFGRRRMVEQYRRVYEDLFADRPLGDGLGDVALVHEQVGG